MNLIAVAKSALNQYRNIRDIRAALSDLKAEELKPPIESTLRSKMPPSLQQIERRRRLLLEDFRVIERVDYGAGAPTDSLSLEEQARGRTLKSTVAAAASASKPKTWATLFYHLTRQKKPVKALEMGTCVGISGAYIATAMSELGAGHLYTLEGDPAVADIATETFKTLGLGDRVTVVKGRFSDTLPSVLERGPFDLVYIDGHHDGAATIGYFEQIYPHLSPKAVVIFDDIRWSEGMLGAWKNIASRPGLIAQDMGGVGYVSLR